MKGAFQIQVTIGIATSNGDSFPVESIDTLLRLADEALYEGKEAGRNQVAVRNIRN